MIKPIPVNLLVHSANYYKRTGVNRDGKKTFDTAIALTRVRFEPTRKTTVSTQGEIKQNKMIFFYDKVNSRPLDLTFTEEDEIEFGSLRLTVREIEALYADRSDVHHWEVLLS